MTAAGHDAERVMLDGSEGEGGGEILRTALSLSLITGRPFESPASAPTGGPPACARSTSRAFAAPRPSAAAAARAPAWADQLLFEPGPTRSGDYVLEVGTAGSTPLLFQCLFFPLALAGGGSLILRGGTHLPHSPTLPLPLLDLGPNGGCLRTGVHLQLRYAGFYPQGGGEFVASVPPPGEPPSVVDLPARGTLHDVDVTSFVGGLPFHIAERQAKAAVSALREHGMYCEAENLPLPTLRSVGTTVFVRAQFENTAAGFSALGERGRPAEEVGRDAAAQLVDFMAVRRRAGRAPGRSDPDSGGAAGGGEAGPPGRRARRTSPPRASPTT